MRVLVTGGAGYIGSVVAAHLVAGGHDVTVLDDLSTGHADAVPPGAALARADVRQAGDLLAHGYDGVLHFAAKSLVSESVRQPERYWDHNLGGSLALLDAMRRHGCPRLVFSSTAAVYGEPDANPIEEDAPARPTNPYGASKLAVDTAIGEYARWGAFGAVSLRYFNVAGASRLPPTPAPDGGGDPGSGAGRWLGERHDPETHLIPIVLEVALDRREDVQLFGTDYPTADGTCVRDYIHVDDLARAHLLALEAASPACGHVVYNLGNGHGFSVREVVETARAVAQRRIPARTAPRRAGDPPVLVASSQRAQHELGWTPQRPALSDIVADAWEFLRSAG